MCVHVPGTEIRRLVGSEKIDRVICRWLDLVITDDRFPWLTAVVSALKEESPYYDESAPSGLVADSMEWFAKHVVSLGEKPPGGYCNGGDEHAKASWSREGDRVFLEWRRQQEGYPSPPPEYMRFWVDWEDDADEQGGDFVGYLQHTPTNRSERLDWIAEVLGEGVTA